MRDTPRTIGSPTVDTELAAVLAEVARIERAFGPAMNPPAQRRLVEARRAPWNQRAPRMTEEDVRAHGVEARRFRPDHAEAGQIVYLHGGGWRVGSIAADSGIARWLASATATPVTALAYPLAPEHPFPAALDSVIAALRQLETGPGRLLLAGCSAGANLALAAAIALRDQGGPKVSGLVLAYGVFGASLDTATYREFGDGRFGLSREAMEGYYLDYVPDRARWADPRVAPLNADLQGLPPTFLAIAEADVLADDSRRMAAALAAAGVAATAREYAGLTHGFMAYASDVAAVARVYADIGAWSRGAA